MGCVGGGVGKTATEQGLVVTTVAGWQRVRDS